MFVRIFRALFNLMLRHIPVLLFRLKLMFHIIINITAYIILCGSLYSLRHKIIIQEIFVFVIDTKNILLLLSMQFLLTNHQTSKENKTRTLNMQSFTLSLKLRDCLISG
jgi:hypothetical protein